MPTSTDMPSSCASCAVASEPMPANVAWHSEISPAMPVMTVIDRKMIAKMTAYCVRNTHTTLAWKKSQ